MRGTVAKRKAPTKSPGPPVVEAQNDINDDIDPENEVTGVKLLLIHIAICLCNFLIGLVTASQPLAGKTYTLFSKKLTYLVYLFVFEIGSLVYALAPTSKALIIGRAVAGLGASGVFAGGFTVLTTIIPLHKRAIWTGTFSSIFALASIIGPILGGALTQNVSWRWCFYINLPIGGAAAALFFVLVHFRAGKLETQPLLTKLEALDGLGFILIAGPITMILLALIWGGVEYPWNSSVVIGLFVGTGAIFILFIFWQIYRDEMALIPPRLFKINRNPALLSVLHATPTRSGINYFPIVIADVLAAFIGSGIVMALGWWNPFLLFAEATVSLGGGLLSTLYPKISTGHRIGYQIFGGIGYSLASNISHLGMQASHPQDLVPIGASTLLTVISTSCAVFNAVAQAVFQERIQINLERVVPVDTVKNIINAGALNFGAFVSPDKLPQVIDAYSKSITQLFYIPASAPVISFLIILGCKWTSTKAKKQAKDSAKTDDASQEKV
ncbi:major facilitator superfamily domain-containing protein [Hypoxylon argillaceum]|nr:major facilitator superfamily domain-containing protein [Hypoxylon argillaceum]